MSDVFTQVFVIGQRVICDFPDSLVRPGSKPSSYEGTVVQAGYRPDQWRVKSDNGEVEMVHESFITPLEKGML